MNFEQLKAAWQASIEVPAGTAELTRATRATHDKARRYQREALLRRIYGSAAFTLTLAMLVSVTLLPGTLWPGMRVALALWSTSMLVCLTGLWHIRNSNHPSPGAPLMTQFEASQHLLRREIAYFRALRWTFWLPFGIGFAFAMAWGAPNAGGTSLFLILGTTVLWLWGFAYGPRDILTDLESKAAQLEQLLHDARSNIGTSEDCQ